MAIFLIRHAQSIANTNQRTLNHTHIPLSDLGHFQAEALTSKLPQIHHVIVSTFSRTSQTAEPLLNLYNLCAETNQYAHEFSYLSERQCQNTNMDERKAWVDEYWDKLDINYRHGNDAESFSEFYHRVECFKKRLLDWQTLEQQRVLYCAGSVEQNLVVFSHGQFLELLNMQIKQHRPLSSRLMQEFRKNLIQQPIVNTQIFKYQSIV